MNEECDNTSFSRLFDELFLSVSSRLCERAHVCVTGLCFFLTRGTLGTDLARSCSSDSSVRVMEWREQSAVSCDEAYLEAQRWIEVSKSYSKLSRRFKKIFFYSDQQELSIEIIGKKWNNLINCLCHHMANQESGVFVWISSVSIFFIWPMMVFSMILDDLAPPPSFR